MTKPLHFLMLKEIAKIKGVNPNYFREFVEPLEATFKEFHIDTDVAKAHFLAQSMHESGGFLFLRELGSNKYFQKYEMSNALGNNKPGDGPKYKGRGLFQLTGRFNYTRASNYFKVDFLSSPELIEQPVWACRTAGWFWESNRMNELTKENDFLGVTFKVNGGFNGVVDRYNRILTAFKVIGFSQEFIDQFKYELKSEIITEISIEEFSQKRTRLKKAFPDQDTVNKYII